MNQTISRRRFLAASAAVTLAGCVTDTKIEKKPLSTGPRVAVIGAGYAGLSAANTLFSGGFDVRLFEARKRVGGRVNTLADFIPEHAVEAGGDFFGANHPVSLAYLKRLSLTTRLAGPMRPRLFLDGRYLADESAKPILDEMDQTLQSLIDPAKAINPEKPWESPNASVLDSMSMYDWLESKSISVDARTALRVYLETENGVALERQNYLAMLSKISAGGGVAFFTQSKMYRCSTGNQSLAQALSLQLPQGRLMLDMAVSSLVNQPDGVVLSTGAGWSETFDYAVLAVPPNLWEKIKIDPEIPKELAPQMGSETVLLCQYEREPWDGYAPFLADGEFSMGWDATRGQVALGDDAGLTIRSSGPAAVKLRELDPYYRESRLKNVVGRIWPNHNDYYRGSKIIDWDTQPWTQCGRSFPAPGRFVKTGKFLDQPHGRILFAGEHASPGFMGTMEGALASGVAVARKIAEMSQKK